MQSQDPNTTHLRSDSPTDYESLSVSHTEFYDERVMTQEIEALTIISNTQEINAVSIDDETSRA